MPKLAAITSKKSDHVEVPSMPWLNEALNGGFVRGGVYLLAGAPGLGKTTLVNQVFGELASNGRKVLYLSSEQTLSEVKSSVERLHGNKRVSGNSIVENFYVDDLYDLDALPQLFMKVLTQRDNGNIEFIAIDSIQGQGVSSNATRKFRSLYEFSQLARAHGIIVILVAHVTKNGSIAGPKTLEHSVDAVLYLRRAFKLRPLFVYKHRFGPDVAEPIVLAMDQRGYLIKSPLSVAKRTAVYGFSGVGSELTEAQAAVAFPKFGHRAELLSPFLPRERVKQLFGVLNTLPGVDLGIDLNLHVSCYLPGGQRYVEQLDVAIALAMLASFMQKAVEPYALFVGELDLTGKVRTPSENYLRALAALVLGPCLGRIRKLFIAREAMGRVSKKQAEREGPNVGDQLEVIGVADLREVVAKLWPDLVAT